MAKSPTYLVTYKDSANARTLYFGPFHSLDLAEEFSKGLPNPLKGGSKAYHVTQPFTFSETSIVTDLILVGRNRIPVAA
jgi:hypothetical protein